jgi:HEAT repeat protein
MPNVFVSYVTEDLQRVNEIVQMLREFEITLWLDRDALTPGVRWKDAIRRSISSGDFFLACFSRAYVRRQKSYMNEELTLAIEELRMRASDRVWFIPAKLSPCEIPDRSIGAGETLRSLQWVELWTNEGMQRLLAVLQPGAEVIEKLIRGLQSTSMRARFRSADALDRLGPLAERALPSLLELAKDSSSQDLLLVSVVSAIGKIGVWTPEVESSLKTVMLCGGYSGNAAGEALARFGDKVIPILLESFDNQREAAGEHEIETQKLGQTVLRALSIVGTPTAGKAIIDTFGTQAVMKYWEGDLIAALGDMGVSATEAIPLITRILTESPYSEVRSKAALALANIAGPDSLDILEQQLETCDPGLRTYVVVALGKINNSRAASILAQCLNDPEASVRWNAAEGLGTIGDESALEPLRRVLSDSSADVRNNADRAIEDITLRVHG